MDRLQRDAGFIGDGGRPAKLGNDVVHDVHGRSYPQIGLITQAPYPIFSKAAAVPSWQASEMMAYGADEFDLAVIRTRMKELGISQAQLARKMGLNQSAISNLLAGTRQVKVHEAVVMKRLLGIETESAVAFVPIIGISNAGNWREAVELPTRTLPIPQRVAGAHAFAVEISGDSMDLLVPEGAFVVVDPDQVALYNDKVYLIENQEHETQVKLYRSNPARFEPASRNSTHQAINLGEHSVRVIGRVVWQGQPL